MNLQHIANNVIETCSHAEWQKTIPPSDVHLGILDALGIKGITTSRQAFTFLNKLNVRVYNRGSINRPKEALYNAENANYLGIPVDLSATKEYWV